MSNCEQYKKKLEEMDDLLNTMLKEKHHLVKCADDRLLLRRLFLVLSKIGYAFGENNKTLRQALSPEEEQIFNLMTNPFGGSAKSDVLQFIREKFVGCESISIYDLYFLGAKGELSEGYLSFIEELAKTLNEINITKLEVFHHSGQSNLNSNIHGIFQGKGIGMTSSIKYQDHLHDRIWLGYQINSEVPKAAAYFGSSFNTVFKKPMIYNQLLHDEISIFLLALKNLE